MSAELAQKQPGTALVHVRRPPAAGMGRQFGSKNKMPLEVKRALCEAFEGTGGVPSLIEWALKNDDNRREFYKLWARIAPLQVDVTSGGESLAALFRAAEERRLRDGTSG